jgi:two-component system, chemotaxis family, protein-glutamate methylesterase/glutaminase
LLPEILNRRSRVPVLYAVHNAPILPARIYVAPAGQRHMLLERGEILLQAGPRENRNRPSIDGLFRSASYAYGSQVIGVILTGNLDDGCAGLADIKARGGQKKRIISSSACAPPGIAQIENSFLASLFAPY